MQRDDLQARRAELEQLSTERLDSMLQRELQKDTPEQNMVTDILAVLREREKDTPCTPTDADQLAWQRYLAHTEQPSERPAKRRGWVLRIAGIAAVLTLVVGMVSYEAGADTFWNRIARWTDSVIEFFNPDGTIPPQRQYVFRTDNPGLQQVYDAVCDLGVTEPVVPMWIPEGYALSYCNKKNSENKTTLMAGFQYGEKVLNYTVAVYSQDVPNRYEKDETAVKTVEIQGVSYKIAKNFDMWIVIWTVENIEGSVSVNCREEELLRILHSIYDEEGTA